MKNIHLLLTSQPSRLRYNLSNVLALTKEPYRDYSKQVNQQIYITSGVEIKDVRPHKGKWQLEKGQILNKFPNYLTDLSECKLVILTTDPDLIKDGVQAIDDEFLEWFVKNPSCDRVEVSKYHGISTSIAEVNAISGDGSLNWKGKSDLRDYKIMIPKEFPKPNIIDNWLEKNGDPEIDKQVEKEAKELCEQNKISQEELERAIFAPINLYSAIKFLFKQIKNK